ncbi:16S rRNA (cytosine(967)-C(5))-methyltransferase RsmB [Clostridium sp. CM028]|uniref:16S rRNA (cytosine(967)-C(5))-methyltransferase RsmB n=1 Tax=unclassified Clostridium TaxID=2614128 RepID=UPI001C0ADDCA|nr:MULTISPECIES: 16S rRNA (cytosine(967)-C(5))-methyltransferase RsmB [unclassified Clostridium]MBU3091597.1 16S rRNA (cytosine(967)-C(5))-methyltransferase RsmB [Clostridium sp. CF011]MBW9144138.1 16S rRNA (cytosine(967)-C(5))-methyltransferase RsmB [Clostridium sp. CM027]MBW9147551.1 16S rRNA (cytosine(967)-C(5))-methyltransferase RsmB [Clostridium sp. CM028]UVE41219.1 16S rRNA (cytosine(967)-C(5))-methyltransferase RsmB [Clostridium sp. CM027]WAG70215.1 16S rRNA (cytosine(967)-C(5))-methylt
MNNSRLVAIVVIEKVINENAYSNIVLGLELNKSDLNDKDKALVTEIVYGTLKYKYTIDKILSSFLKKGFEKVDSFVLNILRISIYQIRFLDKIPSFAVVNEAVNLTKKMSNVGAAQFVNGVLRNYLRGDTAVYYNEKNDIERLCFEYSFTKALAKLFIKQYGIESAEKILSGLNQKPDVTVRVNTLKLTYEEIWEKLIENGYNIEKGYACSEAIRIIKGKNIENNLLFNEGSITVQDESAMLTALSMDLLPNLEVLDLCSAPGGKTTHIAEIMKNTGHIFAFDLHENKLSLIKQNLNRIGIVNTTCDVMDATIYDPSLLQSADRVLIDVPCSGLGIIRKKPEIKWSKHIKDIENIIHTQRKIMENASKYIKKGGVLVYSTCTLNKEENESNIEWFLESHSEFKIEPVFYGEFDNINYSDKGYVTILPNEYMDGFFIAKIIKS